MHAQPLSSPNISEFLKKGRGEFSIKSTWLVCVCVSVGSIGFQEMEKDLKCQHLGLFHSVICILRDG